MNKFPTTNGELLNSEYAGKDDFFVLARLEKKADGAVHLHIDKDLPIAVQHEGKRDEVEKETGVRLPLRKDIDRGNHEEYG